MYADKVDVEGTEQAYKAYHPFALFDDVVDDKIVSCCRNCGQGVVKPLEERWSHRAPHEVASAQAIQWQDAAFTQMVNRQVPEGRVDLSLNRPRKGGLARTRWTVEQDYSAGLHVWHALMNEGNRSALTERLGLGCLTQRGKPTSREDEPRKCNPLLKEQPRYEIKRPCKGFRRHRLQPVAATL